MSERDDSCYRPGRGLPTYLLWQLTGDSSTDTDRDTDSDGASRIFASLSDSMCSSDETHLSSILQAPDTFTYMSTSSSDQTDLSSILQAPDTFTYMSTSSSSAWSDTTSMRTSMVPNTFQYETSTLRSETLSMDEDCPANLSDTYRSYEASYDSMEGTVSVKSHVDYLYSGPVCLTKSYASNEMITTTWDNNLNSIGDHGGNSVSNVRLFFDTETERHLQKDESCDGMIIDDVTVQPSSDVNTMIPEVINYYECCLSGHSSVHECGPTSRHHYGWSQDCVTFSYLSDFDIRCHLKNDGVIAKKDDDNSVVNEKNLIANRLLQKNIIIDDSMQICPKHRSSFGIDWRARKTTCQHPDHGEFDHSSSMNDCRIAKLTTCLKIEGFPIGGRLCSKHRKLTSMIDKIAFMINDAVSIGAPTENTNVSAFVVDHSREAINRILLEVNMSPVKSQATKALESQSKSGIRRLVSKFTRGSWALQEKLAETLTPGQGQELIRMAHTQSQAREKEQYEQTINNEMVQSLKQTYDLYVKQKMPFGEQVRLLSLLPRTWKYEKVMNIFGCTRHAVTAAHQMHDDEDYLLNRDKEPFIRQRADPEKIKHFVSWLVERNTLASGTYGLTTLRMDNGEKFELPKQIIQSQRSHALVDYKKYCDETNFESLGKSKLYEIIDSIKPAQQKVVAGLDEFVTEGIEAWRSLSTIVENMPIPQADRKRLLKQIDMGEQYQKIRHIGHCSDDTDCITHCTIHGLSDPKCTQQHSSCNHSHTLHCPDCINIILTLDEINHNIKKLNDKEIQREAEFDFTNASEHIVEWSRHNLRAAQQDAEKKSIISHMKQDEAFCTFDWGQKILPQEYREAQSSYFGKKGMSVLVGSFVWQNQLPTSAATTITTTDLRKPSYATQSYIVALSDAAQTELDTLSAGEIITKQFKIDYPHINKLHKRTDNAGNFSSHATPEAEKVICERLGIELMTRDYSEVQKGKDICDRICGVTKARMRSWAAIGNDILNAIDIKEGMEYAGGVKNTKIAVAEIIPGEGHLDKTNVPNVSTLRSIRYGPTDMKVFKASGIGSGLTIPYKRLDFETNMRLLSPFGNPINENASSTEPKQRNDRRHHFLILCPVTGCAATFESNTDLECHIAANFHDLQETKPRTANDIARLHLTELVRTTSIDTRQHTTAVFQVQSTSNINTSTSNHYEKFSSIGWGLRARKHSNPMSEKVKSYIEKLWLDSRDSHSKLTAQQIQQQVRTTRDGSGVKLFQTHEYPTLGQIKYRYRKMSQKHGITAKLDLMAEIIEQNTE